MNSMSMKRVGPQMRAAIAYVRAHPGCAKIDVAQRISPHPIPSKNWALGYEPVNRAIKAGLIRAEWHGRGYRLTVVEA